MSRPIASYITDSNESEIFLRGQVQLAAKKPTILPYDVNKRRYGKSTYTTKQLLNVFSLGLISYSIKPLRVAWFLGILISLCSVVYILVDTIFAFINHRQIIEGWKTVVVLLLLLNGFIIFFLGILGEYVGIVFKESKRRPKYIIENTINISK
jgi:dolichol-phosphate mannosyltransferase